MRERTGFLVGHEAALGLVRRARATGRKSGLIGLDVGTFRCGIAATDSNFSAAWPLGWLDRKPPVRSPQSIEAFARRLRVVAESRGACGCVAGWPLLLNGERGHQCAEVENFLAGVMQAKAWRTESPGGARSGGALHPLPIVLVDERFSTAETVGPMRALGFSARAQQKRKDSAAAAVILQRVLDAPRGQDLSRLDKLDLSKGSSLSRSGTLADDARDTSSSMAPEFGGEHEWHEADSAAIEKTTFDFNETHNKGSPEAGVNSKHEKSRAACNDLELMEWLSRSIDPK